MPRPLPDSSLVLNLRLHQDRAHLLLPGRAEVPPLARRPGNLPWHVSSSIKAATGRSARKFVSKEHGQA